MGFSSPHFEQVFSSTGTLPLAVYNLKFAEKQKSGVAARLERRSTPRPVAITGVASHTPKAPIYPAGRGRGETCRANQIYHIVSLCQTMPFIFLRNAPLLLAIEYPCMIVDTSVARHKHNASALSGDGSPRIFMLSLLSTCILPDDVKV